MAKMRTIAHIIHPGLVPESSDLRMAQPITFATMQAARAYAAGQVNVQLYAVKHHDEEFALPDGFTPTPDLNRSVYEFGKFQEKRKLALIKDILDRLYAAATDADYLIYTNVDIALQPYFYVAVNQLLEQGDDALIINRRTISDRFQAVEAIPLMYSEVGEIHAGRDCFVFNRSVYPRYQLGEICIGAPWIGAALSLNLLYHAVNFKKYTDLHLTFHIGNQRSWRATRYQDYAAHNERELYRILHHYRTTHPHFDQERLRLVGEQFAQKVLGQQTMCGGRNSLSDKAIRLYQRLRRRVQPRR